MEALYIVPVTPSVIVCQRQDCINGNCIVTMGSAMSCAVYCKRRRDKGCERKAREARRTIRIVFSYGPVCDLLHLSLFSFEKSLSLFFLVSSPILLLELCLFNVLHRSSAAEENL